MYNIPILEKYCHRPVKVDEYTVGGEKIREFLIRQTVVISIYLIIFSLFKKTQFSSYLF